MRQYIYFSELPPKTEFFINGNTWRKQSTRTAYLSEFCRWFYMSASDLCIVGKHSRLAHDYFTMPEDKRYTITLEYCGQVKPCYILRFCMQWIDKFQTRAEAFNYYKGLTK